MSSARNVEIEGDDESELSVGGFRRRFILIAVLLMDCETISRCALRWERRELVPLIVSMKSATFVRHLTCGFTSIARTVSLLKLMCQYR